MIEASAARDGAVRADRGVWVIDYDIAAVEIHIVDSGEAPGRAGEPRVPPVAPVLCTATFAPTGSADDPRDPRRGPKRA